MHEPNRGSLSEGCDPEAAPPGTSEKSRFQKNEDHSPLSSLSIVIPLFNEEGNVRPLYENLTSVLDRVGLESEIILVNDGSTDGTQAILQTLATRDPRVIVIQFRKNFGQTAALSAGIDQARGDVIISMDGDCQNDPADIPRLLEELSRGFDVVSGWRKERHDPTLTKRWPSKAANFIISWISGIKLHDYGCTLKAYKREIIENVKLYGETHRFVPIYVVWQGGKVAEIPVTHHPRIRGKTNYGLGRTFKVILDLLLIKFLEGYQTKPIYIFGGFGILSFLMAFLAGLVAVYYKVSGQKTFIETPLPLLTALLILVGFLSIFIGLLAELIIRTYFEVQNKPTYMIREIIHHDGSGPP